MDYPLGSFRYLFGPTIFISGSESGGSIVCRRYSASSAETLILFQDETSANIMWFSVSTGFGYFAGRDFYDAVTATLAMSIGNDGTGANLALFAAGSYGGGRNVLFVANAGVVPSSNPTGGGILYSTGGAGTWRGSGGTVTTFGPAGPHCGRCGADFWRTAYCNKLWGAYLYECGWCGRVYKDGPKDFLDLLTEEQKKEMLYG